MAVALVVAYAVGCCAVVFVHGDPLSASLVMGVSCYVAATTARRGIQSPVLLVPATMAIVLVRPPDLPAPFASNAYLAILVGGVLVTGVWAALVVHIFTRRLPKAEANPVDIAHVWRYAITMGVIVTVTTYIVVKYYDETYAGWLIIAMIVVLQPTSHETLKMAFQRSLGTVGGALVAVVIAELSGSSTLELSLGMLVFAVGLTVRLDVPVWQFVGLVTIAVVLFNSASTDPRTVSLDRVGYTVIGALIVVAIATVYSMLGRVMFPEQTENPWTLESLH